MKNPESFATARIKHHQNIVLLMMLSPLVVMGLVGSIFYFSSTRNNNADAATVSIQYGIVTGGDTNRGVNGAASLGIQMARFYEISRSDSPSVLDSYVLNAVKKGVEPLLLVDDDNMAKTTSAGNAGAIASRFGPGGSFWQNGQPGAGYGQYAPRWLEWGNEENLNYKNVIGNGGIYGQSARAAAQAMKASNPNMGLIVQGEDTTQGLSSGQTPWFQAMFNAAPELKSLAAGWTVHPYGPNADRIDSMYNKLVSFGVANRQIFITEDGLSTDNGRNLNNNYGWPTNMTYDQASSAIQQKFSMIKNKSYAQYIRTYMQYQANDQQPSGATSEREHYFGIFKSDGSEKGTYTSTVRTLAAQNPRDGTSGTITPTPAPSPPPPSPAPTYNFTISGQVMKWNLVPAATQYKVYLSDTKTYINLSSTTTNYTVPSPASGSQRQVGWTWYDGQDHWVAEQVVYFTTAPSPAPAPDPTPTPTPTNNPTTPEVVVTRPSNPPPLISIPDADGSSAVPIPEGAPKDQNGQITGDFNADGLNDLVFDLNKDGSIDPKTEIVINGSSEPNLTDKTTDPIVLSRTDSVLDSNNTNGVVSFKAGPLPEVKIAKPVAYTFLIAQGAALTGIGAYLAITKITIFAGIRGKLGL